MEWAIWEPLYRAILDDFQYDPSADVESAEKLAELVKKERIPNYRTIVEKIGNHVSICGAAVSLEDEVGDMPDGRTVVSAGSATARLMRAGITPDVMVTDLDGDVRYEIEANAQGALAFVHAHGDNLEAIRAVVPRMTGAIVPTVQCKPFGTVYNFGGFTDGDRAFFIARHFGVEDVRFLGWDLRTAYPKEGIDPLIKRKKLEWAERLLGIDHRICVPSTRT